MTEIMHGFGDNGELSRGAELALEQWWLEHGGGGGGGGVTDHGALTGRDAPDQHPVGAVTGLQAALDGKAGTGHTHTPGSIGAAPAAHTHAAADVSSGTLAIARIPTGTTGASVALGNHTHTPASIGAATAAQGGLADSAVQPGDDAATLGSGSATSGRVLTADGSGATSWQEAAGGGGGGGYSPPVGAVGSWIGPSAVGLMNANGTAGVWGTDSAVMCPIVIGREIAVDALGFNGGGESGLSTRVLLYAPGESGMPSALIATATVNQTGGASNLVAVLDSPVTLPPGMYWGTIRSNGGTTDLYKAINNGQLALPVTFSDTPSATRPAVPLVNVGTFASPAASVTSFTWHSSNSNLIPQVWLRRSA